MSSKESKEDLFSLIVNDNDGVTRKEVRNLFIWYDLLSYILPFQLILIFIYLSGSNYYSYTMLSVLFVFFMDSILKNSLERDSKNYQKFNKHIPFVKLWVIPLVLMGIVTTIIFCVTKLGII